MGFFAISSTNGALWIFAALIVGYIVHRYDKREVSGGIFLTIMFAVIGALVTGYTMSFVVGKALMTFSLEALLVTIVGASIFAFFYRFAFEKGG